MYDHLQDELPEFVSVKDACSLLGVSRATLDNYVKAGKLVRFEQQAPIRVRYKRAQLELMKRIRPKVQ